MEMEPAIPKNDGGVLPLEDVLLVNSVTMGATLIPQKDKKGNSVRHPMFVRSWNPKHSLIKR